MRIRLLHPEFFSDAILATLTDFARLIFAGLWLIADREGRLADNVKMIDGALLPLDKRSCAKALIELAAAGRIARYRTPAGPVIQIVNFLKYQHPHPKERPSLYHDPASGSANGSASGPAAKHKRPDPSVSISNSNPVTDPVSTDGAPRAAVRNEPIRPER